MRLRIVLPKVNPEAIAVPTECVYDGCGGRTVHLRQEVTKALRDTVYHEVQVHRYQCLRCTRERSGSIQREPPGRRRAPRVKGLAVVLYLLGVWYRAGSFALYRLWVARCTMSVVD